MSDIVIRTRVSEWRVVALADDQHESYGVKRKNSDFIATNCLSMRRFHFIEIIARDDSRRYNGESKATLEDHLQIYVPCTRYQQVA
jgi:hypothetical protein